MGEISKTHETKNACITNVSLSMADHGCLTFYLTLDGGSWGCHFGGYCIGKGSLGAEEFSASANGLEAMMRIMNTVGVERWEDLKGKYLRIVDPGWGGTVTRIGHITDDKWFDIKEYFGRTTENE